MIRENNVGMRSCAPLAALMMALATGCSGVDGATSEEPDDRGVGSQAAPLHGLLSKKNSPEDQPCSYTPSEWADIQRAVLYARTVVHSSQFAACINNKVANGEIWGCKNQDVVKPNNPNYASILINTIDSQNDVRIGCDGLHGIYGLAGNPQSTNGGPEELLANPGLFSEGLFELADTIVHEIMHTKNYWHESAAACGTPYEDGKTVPWQVAGCVNDLLSDSEAIGDIEVCGNGGIALVSTGSNRVCVYAPYGNTNEQPIPLRINALVGAGEISWDAATPATLQAFSTTEPVSSLTLAPMGEGASITMQPFYDGAEPIRLQGGVFTVPAGGYQIDLEHVVTAYRPSLIMAAL